MPIIAAAGAFLGTAGGAAVAGGALAAAGSVYAANQANSATGKAVAAQQQATNQQLALQQQQFDQVRQDQAPYRTAGYSALDALLDRFGLGASPSGGSNGQFIDNAPGAEAPARATGGQPDYAAYLAQNPDVAAEARRVISTDPQSIGDQNHDGTVDDTDYAIYHATTFHDRPVPTSGASSQGSGLTAQQQLEQQIGPEPTFAARQDFTRPGYVNPDVSINAFTASPDYQYRLNEGSRNLNAFNAAKGVLGSGAAGKALVDYGQNTAAAEYGNWRDYVTGQTDKLNAYNQNSFNSDRAYATDIYNTDRANELNRYDTNRSYLTGRYDTLTGNLFNIANLGSGAVNSTNQAGASYANNSGQILQNNANSVSSAFSQTANTNAGLAGALSGIGQSIINAYKPKPQTVANTQTILV